MNLIERLNKAIDIEYDSKKKEINDLKELSIDDLVKKGDAIDNIYAEFTPINPFNTSSGEIINFQKVSIKCAKNLSKFREGSPVILWNNEYSYKLEVNEDNGNSMTLLEDFNVYQINKKSDRQKGWLLTPANVDIRHIVKISTAILSNNPEKLNLVSGIFEGRILPKFSKSREDYARKTLVSTSLNEMQKEAFIKSYATENYYLVQGPPGTGKTWLLGHLATAFAKEGKKVLITAFTHTAINNALQKASVLSPGLEIIKIGKANQTDNLNYGGSKAKNVGHISNAGYSNNSKGIIVGATAYSPFTRKLESINWDIVIIDEAGQMSIPLGIAAMVKGEKYIFIGDHKQLPPIIPEQQTDPLFSKSIFEHLFQFSSGTMLNITYRMNKEINRFSSNQFYNKKLQPHMNNAERRLEITNDFKNHAEILDINRPEVLVCHRNSSDESRSEYEAKLVSELVDQYLKSGIKPEDMAVITPLRAQVREINTYLLKLKDFKTIHKKLLVDTVERMQGQERDVIIYSLVISDPEKAMQRPDFYFNPNRLNVALTRAKKKRIVIANYELFKLKTVDKKLGQLIKNFCDFYETSTVIEESSDN